MEPSFARSFRCRNSKRTLHLIVSICRRALRVAPKPAHDVRENRPALFLSVIANAPGVIHIVSFFRERIGEAHVLVKPIVTVWIISSPARTTIIIPAILKKDPERF